MIRDIITDQFILSRQSVEASKDDMSVVEDLLDTIKAHKQECVGMAANMIGILKRIIVVENQGEYLVMINPVILQVSSKQYKTMEGCLSHIGEKEVLRYSKIKVEFCDIHFKKKIKTFSGFTAQTIQHEMDHLEGILI